jgi:hypothetical protein
MVRPPHMERQRGKMTCDITVSAVRPKPLHWKRASEGRTHPFRQPKGKIFYRR